MRGTSAPDDVAIDVQSDNRRAAVLQKLTGLDGELRRFIVRFVERELDKPHVLKAMRIDLVTLIDNAWEHIASQFLPEVERRGLAEGAVGGVRDAPAP